MGVKKREWGGGGSEEAGIGVGRASLGTERIPVSTLCSGAE